MNGRTVKRPVTVVAGAALLGVLVLGGLAGCDSHVHMGKGHSSPSSGSHGGGGLGTCGGGGG